MVVLAVQGGSCMRAVPAGCEVSFLVNRVRSPNTFSACVGAAKKKRYLYLPGQYRRVLAPVCLVGVSLLVVSRAVERYSHWLFAVVTVAVVLLPRLRFKAVGLKPARVRGTGGLTVCGGMSHWCCGGGEDGVM